MNLVDRYAAQEGDTVKIHFIGKLSDGTVISSSPEQEPLELTIGDNGILPDIENGIVGMAVGDQKTIDIPPERAYGARQEDKVVTVERTQLPPEIDLSVGLALESRQDDGSVVQFRVSGLTDDSVTLDANHMLAGEDLVFEITLTEIV